MTSAVTPVHAIPTGLGWGANRVTSTIRLWTARYVASSKNAMPMSRSALRSGSEGSGRQDHHAYDVPPQRGRLRNIPRSQQTGLL